MKFWIRTTPHVLRELDDLWKNRSYPDPRNFRREIPFTSRSEYLEFVIRSLNGCGDNLWYFIKHVLNPDFPKENGNGNGK